MLAYKKYSPPVGTEFGSWWIIFSTLAAVVSIPALRSYIEPIEKFSFSLGVSTAVGLGFTLGTGIGIFQFFALSRHLHYAFWWIFMTPSAGIACGIFLARGLDLLSVVFLLQAIIMGFFVGVRPQDLFTYKPHKAVFRFLFTSIAMAGIIMTVYLTHVVLTLPNFPDRHWVEFPLIVILGFIGFLSGVGGVVFFLLSIQDTETEVSIQDHGEAGPRE